MSCHFYLATANHQSISTTSTYKHKSILTSPKGLRPLPLLYMHPSIPIHLPACQAGSSSSNSKQMLYNFPLLCFALFCSNPIRFNSIQFYSILFNSILFQSLYLFFFLLLLFFHFYFLSVYSSPQEPQVGPIISNPLSLSACLYPPCRLVCLTPTPTPPNTNSPVLFNFSFSLSLSFRRDLQLDHKLALGQSCQLPVAIPHNSWLPNWLAGLLARIKKCARRN